MAPWKHVHAWANGYVYPCCLSNNESEFRYGNLNEKSLSELFNSDVIKQMRLDLLAGKKHGACTRCYEQEDMGFRSMRNSFNEQYYDANILSSTNSDGSVDNIVLPYWDLRFSNICNMKCRTCGPDFSTQWHSDAQSLGNSDLKVKKIRHSIIEESAKYANDIDQVYFAGGEPLIMDEHWQFVNQLKNKNIRFYYQTNMSQLFYKGNSAIDLWNTFENVTVTASLDAHGDLASYVRSGTNWDKIEENIKLVREQCPHVVFNVSCTTSILNVHSIIEFYEYLINNNLVNKNNFEINPVMFPHYYKVDLLPNSLLSTYKNKINKYIDKLKTSNEPISNTIAQFSSLVNMLEKPSKYKSTEWDQFVKITNSLDNIRNENFRDYLTDLIEYV